jgi:hypothetical protein
MQEKVASKTESQRTVTGGQRPRPAHVRRGEAAATSKLPCSLSSLAAPDALGDESV